MNTLPVGKAPLAGEEAYRYHPALISKSRILIADADRDSRQTMRQRLMAQGHEVFEAEDGERILQLVEEHRPEVILLDYQLPLMDGLAATREIRAHPHFFNIPVFIVSAQSDSASRFEALVADCDEFFSKPLDFRKLEMMLARYLLT